MRIRARPDIGQLKKQAKELLALYRRGDPAAMQRFRAPLPAARGRNDEELAGRSLRLHDAQSCIAREYGFPSWADLQVFVLARPALADDPEQAVRHWVRMVYAGDVAGGNDTHRPAVAARMLAESPTLAGDDDSYLACAIGNEQVLRRATARDPAWVHREGGPLNLPPLVAVTHSGLATRPGFRERLRDCARFLLSAGASANQSVGNRWPPASLEVPSQTERLSALYGAAGKAFDPQLTRLLLEAGADPNDGESLYHSLEAPACTRLLLEAGARIAGSNAMYRALDLEDPGVLELLLAHGGDANEPALGPPTSDRGDAELTRFLLEHGADWRTLHGFGDNAGGSLSRASLNEPVRGGDWVGCAEALRAHGLLPAARPDPAGADVVLIGDRRYRFADDVAEALLGFSDAPAH